MNPQGVILDGLALGRDGAFAVLYAALPGG
jgi:hypothetical protein